MRNRTGLTLVELLLTLAITGVLVAMLAPVFARERVAARDTQCMANVKAIANAIRLYADEYEALWPGEGDERVLEYFSGGPGRGGAHPGSCNRTGMANPYLRPAVILERYLKSRDVWKCPRATTVNRAVWVVPSGRNGDWLQSYRDHEGGWGLPGRRGSLPEESASPGGPQKRQEKGPRGGGAGGMAGPCLSAFPPGWGGRVTDAFVQGVGQVHVPVDAPESNPPAFVQAIATNSNLANLKLSRVGNPGKFIVCGDCGVAFEARDITSLAFPDTCATQACGYTSGEEDCANLCNFADWEECPWTRACGLSPAAHARLLTDAKYRKSFTRHSGGSNVGFLDGHAKWYLADFLLKHSQPFKYQAFEGGLCACWPGNAKVPADAGKQVKRAKKPAAAKPKAGPAAREGGEEMGD